MSDLIDRQAAMAVIENRKPLFTTLEYVKGINNGLAEAQSILKEMPAADISEQLENAYAHGYTAAEAEFRKVMEAERWIPVTERLPEDDVSVLISYIGLTRDKEQYKGVTIATYDSDFEGWYRDNDFAAIAAVVTAWQPLPEPYKGGEL